MIQQSDVTIVIPHIFLNKETEFALEECLTSLDETVPDMKKIVAINGMRFENDFETIKFPNVKFIVLEDQGQCRATNAAVATTNTPWIFITNNDMVYAPGWFEELVAPLGEKFVVNTQGVDMESLVIEPGEMIAVDNVSDIHRIESILCISPQLVEPKVGAPTFLVEFCGGAGGDFDKTKWLAFAKGYHGKGLRTGFNLPFLIKKELWDTIGGYDINYDPWGSNSDSDLEYKIRLAGVQPYQNTNCLVYHFSQTSGTFHPDNQSYWQKNWDYFIEKFGFPRTDEGIWTADFHMPTREEGRIFFPEWEGKYGS